MRKLLLILFILPGVASGYWEISNDVPTVFSAGGDQQWRMWAGQDAASSLFDDSVGILFDDLLETVIIGNFTPGASRPRHTAVGFKAGEGFDGDFTTAIGGSAGLQNTADHHTAIGVLAGAWNDGIHNTALGSITFNAFNLDTVNAKNVTSVDPANNRMTVSGGHGFGSDGTFRNLIATTTGFLPEGFSGAIHTWEIISSTVLEVRTSSFTDEGTGTHTLTPQYVYDNSTALGYNAEPDASNQVMLGDTNVTEVKTTGSINAGGGITLGGNIIIPDDGLIGSVSDTDAIQIEADGDVVMSQDLTVDGTISDGTATLTGGNYSSVGTITSGDITILDPTPILVFRDNNSSGAASVGFIEWRDSGGGRAGFLGNNSSGNDDLFWKNEQGGNIGIQTTGAGKVQIFADVELNGNLTGADIDISPGTGDYVSTGSFTTSEFTVEADGDTFWTGAGTGIPYGHMYVDGTQSIIVALTLNTPTEVEDDGTTSAEDGWLAGDLNLITFPTGGTEHYLTIGKSGIYHITWNLSFKMVTGAANTQIHAGLAVNTTTFVRNRCEAHRTISNNSDIGNMGGTCMRELIDGSQISLWMENTTNSNDADIVHGSLTALMVGGASTEMLLLETGDFILLETGDKILLEG